MKQTWIFLFVVAFVIACFVFEMPRDSGAQARETERSDFDEVLNKHSQLVMENGRQIFRYETFGSGAIWGDALPLHNAIAGEKNGGVGGGVSPKTALLVGAGDQLIQRDYSWCSRPRMRLSVQATAGNQAATVPDPFGFGEDRPSSPSFSFASSAPGTDGDIFDLAHPTPFERSRY